MPLRTPHTESPCLDHRHTMPANETHEVTVKLPTILAAGVTAVFLIVVVLLLRTGADGEGTSTPRPSPNGSSESGGASADAGDMRILGERGTSDVTFTEFLDFECEACGAAYPVVEQVREKYAGKVTFEIRYFPIPSHFNADRAARAVESAARQGKLTEMYNLMYTNQKDWAEQQEPKDELFRSYAESLGLDMKRYDADYGSTSVAERVQRDVKAGTELGVQGTPTFFINGELFEPSSVQDFDTALDEALSADGSS